MSHRFPKLLTLGLGAVIVSSIFLPSAAEAKPGKKNNKPQEASVACNQTELGVLSNFCDFRSGNDDGGGLSGTLAWLDTQSPDDWEKFFKVDSSSGNASRSGVDLNVSADTSLDGTWTMDFSELLDLGYSEFAVAVKAGNGHAIYGYDTADFMDASTYEWSTVGLKNGGGQQPGLSHFTVYVKRGEKEPTPAPVPEPMSILGLVAFGGGAVALKRRQRLDA